MKTAMQELIDYMQELNTRPYVNGTTFREGTMNYAKQMLEKEKEQIIEAANNGALKSMVHREKLDKMSEDELRSSLLESTDAISYGEDYYNQNK
jgi:hypothetical protein